MKRKLLIALMTLIAVLQGAAQKVYGDKQGWTVYTMEDEFSGKKSHYLRYYDQQKTLTASFFPNTNKLAVLEWYDGKLFFDVTFDAVMDNRGHIPAEEIDYEIRINLPKGESNEDYGTVKLKFNDVEKSGETFFGTFTINVDSDDLKRGSTVAVRWYDPIRGRQTVRKINLSGFTKCYNECIHRYIQQQEQQP